MNEKFSKLMINIKSEVYEVHRTTYLVNIKGTHGPSQVSEDQRQRDAKIICGCL